MYGVAVNLFIYFVGRLSYKQDLLTLINLLYIVN